MTSLTDTDRFDAADDGPDELDASPADVTVLPSWRAFAALAAVGSFVLLIGAGMLLSEVGLGRAVVARGCDLSHAVGLLLLAAAGALMGAARVFTDRRVPSTMYLDRQRALALLPVPALGVLLAGPGFLGCSFAVRFDTWGAPGSALLGTPGIAIAAASAFALGLAVLGAVVVRVPVELLLEQQRSARARELDPVERALAAHGLLEEGAGLDEDDDEPGDWQGPDLAR